MNSSHQWGHLNRQQSGAYSEYYVKMELTKLGFQVYSSEVDDRGVDFVARFGKGAFISVQVKSIREYGYVFMRKAHFDLEEDSFIALVLLFDQPTPDLFLIPAKAWEEESALFRDRNYRGKKSAPEWGLNVSRKNYHLLAGYSFERTAAKLIASAT